jgi:UDPglucose 6-dehydrogenase
MNHMWCSLEPQVVQSVRGKNMFFSTAIDETIAEADIIFISVNTPTKTQGIGAGRAANVKNCELCARKIAEIATSNKIVVEKSTVPVRTAHAVNRVLASSAQDGVTFQVKRPSPPPVLGLAPHAECGFGLRYQPA